ncbi:MAG: hypothetical protein ACOYLO_00205 [Ferruginibacter sp.]
MKPNIGDEIVLKIDEESLYSFGGSFCGESEYTTKVIAINESKDSRVQTYLVPFDFGWLLSKGLCKFKFPGILQSCSDIDKYFNTRVAWVEEKYIIEVMPCG